jgi:hypothetical protein
MAEFHRPTRMPTDMFEDYIGGDDPADVLRAARDTAHALVDRGRDAIDPAVVERLVAYTDANGIDAIAELWARSHPHTLPGALWRIYLLRVVIRQDPAGTSLMFQRGAEVLRTIDPVVAGAIVPTGPEEITELADRILRGLFTGDFSIALDRAAAFCRVLAAGAGALADDADLLHPDRATEFTVRADRYAGFADDLGQSARLHRRGRLE